MSYDMDKIDEALEEIIDAGHLMRMAYEKLMPICREHSDVTVWVKHSAEKINEARMHLSLASDDFAAILNADPPKGGEV